MSAIGRRAVAIQGDISKVADTQRMVKESVDALGGLDILVNNAGVEKHASFWVPNAKRQTARRGPFIGTESHAL
jgi:NAD(P)-dependent dehydrogenase (short-subunit alcohol dehydrogenase family)